jgi:hypothetical protein
LLLHPPRSASASSSSSSASQQQQLRQHAGLLAQPEGTEVYFVPYLSAIVLYERSDSTNNGGNGGGGDPSSSPPLLSWFEGVSPHLRTPFMESIREIGSCFSPPPSSPLYARFAPFPSQRLLHELRVVEDLDVRRSWLAVTWYPILHDPLAAPFVGGAFLLYHSLQLDVAAEEPGVSTTNANAAATARLRVPRWCPLQESDFLGVGPDPAAQTANGTTVASSAAASSGAATTAPVARVPASLFGAGASPASGGDESEDATDADADADADVEADDGDEDTSGTSEAEGNGHSHSDIAAKAAAAFTAAAAGGLHATAAAGTNKRRVSRRALSRKLLASSSSNSATNRPTTFPPHLCPHCGDRHGPPTAPLSVPELQSPFLSSPSDVSASASASVDAPLACLPLLGYLCHRVLPSTFFVQACYQPPLPPLPPLASIAASAAAAVAAAANANAAAAVAAGSNGAKASSSTTHPSSSADSLAASSVSAAALAASNAYAYAESVASFNAALHPPASFSFSHLSLSLAQPARLTHVDLSTPMQQVLLKTHHLDFAHMSSVQGPQ